MKKLCIMLAVVLAFGFVFTGCDIGFFEPSYEPPVEPSIPDAPPFIQYIYIEVDGVTIPGETPLPAGYPINVSIGGTAHTYDVPKYVITVKSGGTVVDSIVGAFDNPVTKQESFYQLISINTNNTAGSFTVEVYFEDSNGNKSNTLTTAFTVFDGGYITVWPNPQMKQIEVVEGIKTVALLATGNHCDVYYDITVSQPPEWQLMRIVYDYDNDYVRVTSFLGLYENGGGPGGDGGVDGNPRIQIFIYDLDLAGGIAGILDPPVEGLCIDIYAIIGNTFVHELCHVIFYGNSPSVPPHYYGDPDIEFPPDAEIWYREFLSCMSEGVFYDFYIDWTMPNVELFGVWENNDGGPEQLIYYNTYRKLSKFLVDKYGDVIFYDLFHELFSKAVNKQALENVLGVRGQTISAMEVEFAAWCDSVNAMIAI